MKDNILRNIKKFKFMLRSFIDVIIYIYYKALFSIKKTNVNDTWLISERGIDARDNGYWFYKYMKENHKEIPIKYVISSDSIDYNKIDKEDIVEYRSKEHYYYFIYSKCLISAEIMGFSPNEQLFYRLNKYGLIKLNGKNIFLQHGITKDYNSYMEPKYTKLDLFICGAVPEKKLMIEKYGYSKEQAVLTGFARFDKLENLNEKIILIMPTWRKWLKYSDTLIGTDYYNNYMNILNDKKITKLLKEKGFKIIFYPHIIFQKFINEFYSESELVQIASFNDYDVQDLLKRASLLITDYSSVAFDFAYMNKKVVYFQFDKKKYRNEQYASAGDFYSYEKNGFGPVTYKLNEIKNLIMKYLNNEKCFDEYNSRISNYFGVIDKNNCQRIYEQILKIINNNGN